VAYTALPLVLSALDRKLSCIPREISSPMWSRSAYSETMKVYSSHYNGIKEVSSTMERILAEAELHSLKLYRKATTLPIASKDWYEIFVQHPKLHLRVALSFDLSFSRGRFPEDEDFPREVRMDHIDKVPWSSLLKIKETSLKPSDLEPDALNYILRQVTDLKSPAVTARSDLDFLELFTEDGQAPAERGLQYGDSINLTVRCPIGSQSRENSHRDNDLVWKLAILKLFDQSIPA
jgi:hypothetical protein